MVYKSYQQFKESIFSFFKPSDKLTNPSLVGKLVAVESKFKSSDGYGLIHIYEIKDAEGKVGNFIGNIKFDDKIKFFKNRIGGDLVEKLEIWRELSPEESNIVKKIWHPSR